MSRKNNRGKAAILFTKVPEAGRVKTRMMPYLDADGCRELQICFLKDIKKALAGAGIDIIVCYDTGNARDLDSITGTTINREADAATAYGRHRPPEVLQRIFGKRAKYLPQRGQDIGEKMLEAFRDAADIGYTTCLLMGSDIPDVSTDDISNALGELDHKDIVIGPSADGGYWLIGMHRPHRELFENREYSHGSVFEELVRTADELGLSYGLAALHQDVDTPADLAEYRACMREDASLRRSHTGRFARDLMSISLILPVYNEISTIDRMVSQLESLRGNVEIIIADGGSTDGTCTHIPDYFTVLHTGKGRAIQMNACARAAHGDILFFLHCDCELPDDPVGEIRRIMAKYEVGCFGVAFRSRHVFMFTNRLISNIRAKHHRIMFGDQGIFMTRELFDRIGGFPELPIMEDYQVSLTLREMGIRTGMTRRRIYTSDRRYPKDTVEMLRLMAKMYRLRREYKAGRPPEDIAEEYGDVR